MIQIRQSVFETNSSSTHVIALNGKSYSKVENKFYRLTEDNKVLVNLGEYGWGPDYLEGSDNKLSYLMTMICMNCIQEGCETFSEVYESDYFYEIETFIKENTTYFGIVIDRSGDNTDRLDTGDFYIDHQSLYNSYKEFLDDYDLTLYDYLFNSKYYIIIDNDNHY